MGAGLKGHFALGTWPLGTEVEGDSLLGYQLLTPQVFPIRSGWGTSAAAEHGGCLALVFLLESPENRNKVLERGAAGGVQFPAVPHKLVDLGKGRWGVCVLRLCSRETLQLGGRCLVFQGLRVGACTAGNL